MISKSSLAKKMKMKMKIMSSKEKVSDKTLISILLLAKKKKMKMKITTKSSKAKVLDKTCFLRTMMT